MLARVVQAIIAPARRPLARAGHRAEMGRHPIAPAGKEAVTNRNRLYCRSEPAGDADLQGPARWAEHPEEPEREGKIHLVGQIIKLGVKLEQPAAFIPDPAFNPLESRQGEVVG